MVALHHRAELQARWHYRRSGVDRDGPPYYPSTPERRQAAATNAIFHTHGAPAGRPNADLNYDALVIATGAVPRPLPGVTPRPGLHQLRTVDDAQAIRSDIRQRGELVVVGAGFMGCEVAASTRELGASVTLVEAVATPLERALGPVVGREVSSIHAAHGVDERYGTKVSAVLGDNMVEGVELDTGARVDTRVILAALGVTPATSWLKGSGLEVDDGVICDGRGRTSAEGVFAVGDVARWAPPRGRPAGRHEHWTTAGDQARTVAGAIVDPKAETPAGARAVLLERSV